MKIKITSCNPGVKLLLALFIACLLNINGDAQTNNQRKYVTITGSITRTDASMFIENGHATIYGSNAMDRMVPVPGTSADYPIHVKDGKFNIRLPLTSKYGYLSLNIEKKLSFLNAGYPLVCQGDSLNFEIKANEIIVSGSDKASIDFQQNCYKSKRYLLKMTAWDKNQLPMMFKKCDSIIRAHQFKPVSHGRQHSILLNAEYQSRFQLTLLNAIYPLKNAKDEGLKKKAGLLLSDMKYFSSNDPKAFITSNALHYINCIYLYNELKISFGNTAKKELFGNLYHTFHREYPFPLNDRMNAFLFWKNYNKKGNDQRLLVDAHKTIKDSLSKEIIQKVWDSKAKGQKAFAFELPDTSGRVYRLQDFKGKTLVIHFWFTNCAACRILSKDLHPIIDKYKNDTSVVFLNISVDKDRKKWKESVKTGLYTHPNEKLLFTNGEGANHPFLKYYNFVAFPSMLIIDSKGNLITANPVRPIDETTSQQFEFFLKE